MYVPIYALKKKILDVTTYKLCVATNKYSV